MPHGDTARRGRELIGVFCIHAAFNRMSAHHDLALGERKFLASGDHDLGTHNINTSYQLCDRMLHLHARVHFNEVKLAILIQKLKGPGAPIADFFACRHATVTDSLNQLAVDPRCR